jgi:Leucine-rich repeat (LRR) protein
LQFYLDTGGASWTSHSLWRTTEPICSWEGILCDDGSSDDDSGVTGIWLKGNNLVGTVPNGLWNLPSLRIFDVQDNRDLFINIGGMPSTNKVEILLLSGTRIQNIRGVSHAQHLEEIHLTECGISGPFPQELFVLKSSLRGIFISFNSFSGTLPTQIGNLSNLENFYAFDNELSGSIPSEIGVLTNLQNLGKHSCSRPLCNYILITNSFFRT